MECPICLEVLDNDIIVCNNNHIYHNSCIKKHIIYNNNNCPICNEIINHELQNKIELFEEKIKEIIKYIYQLRFNNKLSNNFN